MIAPKDVVPGTIIHASGRPFIVLAAARTVSEGQIWSYALTSTAVDWRKINEETVWICSTIDEDSVVLRVYARNARERLAQAQVSQARIAVPNPHGDEL